MAASAPEPLQIIIATSNPGKVRDFSVLLGTDFPEAQFVGTEVIGGMPEVDETGTTFEANARLKAEAVWQLTQAKGGYAVMADDSGLAVDYLGGAPGVYSARYAGVGASDGENRDKLLDALQEVPVDQRSARFVCNLCLILPEGQLHQFEAYCEGTIANKARGENGFGYDPVFIGEGMTETFGECSPQEKAQRSHRAKAVGLLRDFLSQQVG